MTINKSEVRNRQLNTSLNQFSNLLDQTARLLSPIPWLTRIFGCWHKKTGIPFTREGQTYSTCMLCGASRKFDINLWKNTGPFYYSPAPSLYDFDAEKTNNNSKVVTSLEIDRWLGEGGRN